MAFAHAREPGDKATHQGICIAPTMSICAHIINLLFGVDDVFSEQVLVDRLHPGRAR